MKKVYLLIPLFAAMMLGSCNKEYDDSSLWSKVNSIDQRVTNLESTLSQMNNDISSLKLIVDAMKKNVYVTNVTDIGSLHQITFSDGSTVVIKDGQDGKDGSDGLTPTIGSNGNWWIGQTDTGVKVAGTNGQDGLTPYIGTNGNWWIGQTDTGVKAAGTDGQDGLTPFIGTNGNWWIGQSDTGVAASGSGSGSSSENVPIISIKEENGVYYWIQILNGQEKWLTDVNGDKLPVSGKDGKDGKDGKNGADGADGVTPILAVSDDGYWIVSYDNGSKWYYITDVYNQKVSATGSGGGSCTCKQFFQNVYVSNGYLVMVLIDGTVIYFEIGGGQSAPAAPNPLPRDPNIVFPNPKFEVQYVPGRGYVLVIYISGMRHPVSGDWLDLHGSDENDTNTWVDIDDEPAWVDIEDDETGNTTKPVDVTFLVDNSGSMKEEADLVASEIISWAQKRTAAGLDIRFGCVGFSVSGTINGGLSLGSAQVLSSYLNSGNRTGTERTVGWAQKDAALKDVADNLSSSNDECGGMALRFADSNFNFRSNAIRHYIIFTDEPNQPNSIKDYSLTWFENSSNWPSEKGVVHTIYSCNSGENGDGFTETLYKRESYRRLEKATGGQFQVTDGQLTGLNMEALDVTTALDKTTTIWVDLNSRLVNGMTHNVRLTYVSADKQAVGQTTYRVTLSAN